MLDAQASRAAAGTVVDTRFMLRDEQPDSAWDYLAEPDESRIFAPVHWPGPVLLTPEEANQQYGIPGELVFTEDVYEVLAQEKWSLKFKELHRETIMRRADTGVFTKLLAGLIASSLDPLNIAVAFIPIVRERHFLAMVGRIGLPAARVVRGAVEGAVGTAMLEPLVYGAARSEQAHYDITDSLLNVTFGTVLGAGLHLGVGAIGDRLNRARARRKASPFQLFVDDLKPGDQQALARTSVAQLIEGRPIDVGPVLDVLVVNSRQSRGSRTALGDPTLGRVLYAGEPPEISVAIDTPDVREILARQAPELLARVTELRQQAADLRARLAEMRDDKMGTVSLKYDQQIEALQLELLTADKKRGRAIAAELSALYDERVKAREAAAEGPGDIPEMAVLRQRLVETDYALRDIAAEFRAATVRAEKKVLNLRKEAERITAKLAPVIDRNRAAGGLGTTAQVSAEGGLGTTAQVSAEGGLGTTAQVSAEGGLGSAAQVSADASTVLQRVIDNLRAVDSDKASAAATTTERVSKEQGASKELTDEIKNIEEELAHYESIIDSQDGFDVNKPAPRSPAPRSPAPAQTELEAWPAWPEQELAPEVIERKRNEIAESKDDDGVVLGTARIENIQEVLEHAVAKEWLSPEAKAFVDWMLARNPAIMENLTIHFVDKPDPAAGYYHSAQRVIEIFRDSYDWPRSLAHELLHHLEKFMPEDIRAAIRAEWEKGLAERRRVAVENSDWVALDYLKAVEKSGITTDMLDQFAKGELLGELYPYSDPSEYWAVNASRLVAARASADTWVKRAVLWIQEVIAKAQELFGFSSDAPILRALDYVLTPGATEKTDLLLIEEGSDVALASARGQQRIKELRKIIDARPPSAIVEIANRDISDARGEIREHERQHAAERTELNQLLSGEIPRYPGSKKRERDLIRILKPPASAVKAIQQVASAKTRLENFNRRKIAAKAELENLEREPDRYVGELSIQPDVPARKFSDPTPAEQEAVTFDKAVKEAAACRVRRG